MTMQELVNYFDSKIAENENFIKITFYELRLKYNILEEEINHFLEIAKNKFENMGYNVYFTGEYFDYKNSKMKVQDNEYMVAIKK